MPWQILVLNNLGLLGLVGFKGVLSSSGVCDLEHGCPAVQLDSTTIGFMSWLMVLFMWCSGGLFVFCFPALRGSRIEDLENYRRLEKPFLEGCSTSVPRAVCYPYCTYMPYTHIYVCVYIIYNCMYGGGGG